ncbi:hypothetical protein [Limnoglobus roseus]|uniref:Uncharacterized protein n=1 Tax=Limnoglobus roseus TaxID=2598579 RepID=A0A5C1A6N0_9BACT|nr:hypothetical protein [Limnoglobus roseus]QEL14841.1 hypothetical protein PX52LOC_01739 [Limnoglobus roseus]
MSSPNTPRPNLSLECLEVRDMPAAGQWLVEPFQRGPVNGLPSGWSQWSNDGSKAFQVDAYGAGLGDSGRLVSSGTSTTTSRAWVTSSYSVNVDTSAAVYLTSTSQVQLFVRGQNLGTTTASYYAASVTRGGQVQLLKVVDGKSTVLGTVNSSEYLSNRWVTIDILAAGSTIQVRLNRGDTNQYLGPDGKWTRQPVAAIDKTDTSVPKGGFVGFARNSGTADSVALDSLRIGPSGVPVRDNLFEDRFAAGKANGLPSGWGTYTTAPAGQLTLGTETDETLRITAPGNAVTRAWLNRVLPDDVQVSSSIYVDSLIPASIVARGTSLGTATPTYYGLTVTRGLNVTLTSVVNGKETVLGTVASKDYVSGQWIQASLIVKGSSLRAQIYRSDTGQYLNADGTWSLTPSWAMSKSNTAIRTGERVGLIRGTGVAGTLTFDNFIVTSTPDSLTVPDDIPTEQDKTGTPIIKTPEDPPVVPPIVPPTIPPPPTVPPPPTTVPPAVPPTVPPVVPPVVPPTVPPPPTTVPPVGPTQLPTVPRHYSYIRVAQLAYYGTPFGTTETSILKNSVDLVIPNTAYLSTINSVSPNTPQFIYTNVTNIYLDLYTDWLAYADKNKISRESAFYHVTKETPFIGLSASSVPVNQFWGVYSGSDATGWTNVTSNAQQSMLPFALSGTANQSVAFGYPEKYRELNFDIKTAAAGTWAGQYEYVSAVDANGKPTKWSTLNTLTDTTTGMKRDGQVTFDPPKDWVAASINGSARLFYVRETTTKAGTAPQINTVLGRDYTNFKGAVQGGVTPAFDYSADKDGDGYLNNAEWAARKAGFNARFVYESRLFYPTYGPSRFATNIGNASFQAWAVDYSNRVLASQPLADGLFVDNSTGKIAVDPATIKENFSNYANDHGALLGKINNALKAKGKWIVANTAGSGTAGEPIAKAGVTYLEEFAIRPVSSNHVQFDDLAAMLAYRRQLSGGKAYEILDSLVQGMDWSDPRVQLTTLAMYYTLADPNLSMLMMNGGNEPASSWTRHWTDAIKFNVGQPTGDFKVVQTGVDPANKSLVYKVYGRTYQNALVLYKPLSYTRGVNGTTADNTATVYQLDGYYRPVKADGTLGTAVNKITLRNGEGVILAKVK